MTKSREIRQKILKIMDLALKISPPDRERKLGETVVFVEYSAHCPALSVRVYTHGWNEKNGPDKAFWMLTFREDEFEQLNEIIEYLQDLREEMNNEQN